MGTRRGGGGGSASRVGDWDVDLRERWDWGSIPRLLSSACLFFCSGGCFGCCDKTVKQLGELSRSLITHDQLTVGEPFWSTTTIDVSQSDLRGFPQINTSSWNLDQHGAGSSYKLPLPESANPDIIAGLTLWEQTREEWTEIKRLRPKLKQTREPVLSWSAAYQSVLGSDKPLPQPVPLHEMVDFLVELWEQEGLYD